MFPLLKFLSTYVLLRERLPQKILIKISSTWTKNGYLLYLFKPYTGSYVKQKNCWRRRRVNPDTVLIRSRYNNIEDTGLFSHACYEWRMSTTNSWILFQKHFTNHDRDYKKQGTAGGAGFHNTNGVYEMRTEMETIIRGNSTTTDVSVDATL